MGDQRAHSIFAPSASKRWMTCPASIKESEGKPEQADTPASIEGTDAHWVAEQMLKCNLKSKSNSARSIQWRGTIMPSGTKTTKIMVGHVGRYVDYVWRHFEVNGGQLYIENRLEMPKIDTRMWGSGDAVQITKYKTLHAFDLKYGMWLVEAEANHQMQCYLIGALTRHKNQIDLSRETTAHICQVRPDHPDGQFRPAKFSIPELIKFGNEAKAAIKESDSKNQFAVWLIHPESSCAAKMQEFATELDAQRFIDIQDPADSGLGWYEIRPNPRMVSGDHCVFCPAEFTCPELNKLGRKVWT